jgi:hypothetical protein
MARRRKIAIGARKVRTNKNGSFSFKQRTSKSTWKTVRKVKAIKSIFKW